MEDVSQSIECLCHIMTTVGSKLDTDKAKVMPRVNKECEVKRVLNVLYALYKMFLESHMPGSQKLSESI